MCGADMVSMPSSILDFQQQSLVKLFLGHEDMDPNSASDPKRPGSPVGTY